MTTADSGHRVRRALTTDEIDSILAGVDRAGSPAELITTAVRALFTALLSGTGAGWDDLSATGRLDPGAFAIPTGQHRALTGAITNRAQQWGASVQIALTLVEIMPSSYDDPTVPEPAIAGTDHRPPSHHLHASRQAVDVIAACEAHLANLGNFYGYSSTVYRNALASWHGQLAGLFSMSLGADTQISAEGELSLFVRTGSGHVYAIIWHPARRHCTRDGCGAAIHDDGTIEPTTTGVAVLAHEHRPSYPLRGPRPGEWTSHS